jgi:hypothetical protein
LAAIVNQFKESIELISAQDKRERN